MLRVFNLGVELDAVYLSLLTLVSRTGAQLCISRDFKPLRESAYHISMTHKHLLRAVKAFKERRLFVNRCGKRSVFALFARRDLTAEHMGDELRAITNSEHGNPERIQRFIALRRVFKINTVRTAREYYSYRSYLFYFFK